MLQIFKHEKNTLHLRLYHYGEHSRVVVLLCPLKLSEHTVIPHSIWPSTNTHGWKSQQCSVYNQGCNSLAYNHVLTIMVYTLIL